MPDSSSLSLWSIHPKDFLFGFVKMILLEGGGDKGRRASESSVSFDRAEATYSLIFQLHVWTGATLGLLVCLQNGFVLPFNSNDVHTYSVMLQLGTRLGGGPLGGWVEGH